MSYKNVHVFSQLEQNLLNKPFILWYVNQYLRSYKGKKDNVGSTTLLSQILADFIRVDAEVLMSGVQFSYRSQKTNLEKTQPNFLSAVWRPHSSGVTRKTTCCQPPFTFT